VQFINSCYVKLYCICASAVPFILLFLSVSSHLGCVLQCYLCVASILAVSYTGQFPRCSSIAFFIWLKSMYHSLDVYWWYSCLPTTCSLLGTTYDYESLSFIWLKIYYPFRHPDHAVHHPFQLRQYWMVWQGNTVLITANNTGAGKVSLWWLWIKNGVNCRDDHGWKEALRACTPVMVALKQSAQQLQCGWRGAIQTVTTGFTNCLP
jgi:hypothetical protein